MTQYITLNVKLFNSQLNELESGIKVSTEVTSIFHQVWLVILTMRLIFHINYH